MFCRAESGSRREAPWRSCRFESTLRGNVVCLRLAPEPSDLAGIPCRRASALRCVRSFRSREISRPFTRSAPRDGAATGKAAGIKCRPEKQNTRLARTGGSRSPSAIFQSENRDLASDSYQLIAARRSVSVRIGRLRLSQPVAQTSPRRPNGAPAPRIGFISMKVSFIDTKLCR